MRRAVCVLLLVMAALPASALRGAGRASITITRR
jgi:hypothetical protein